MRQIKCKVNGLLDSHGKVKGFCPYIKCGNDSLCGYQPTNGEIFSCEHASSVLTEEEEIALEFLKSRPEGFTIIQISKKLKISHADAKYRLLALVLNDLVRFPDGYGRWSIKNGTN